MSISILMITHGDIGRSFLKTVKLTLGELPLPCKAIGIKRKADPDILIPKLKRIIEKLDQGDGVLLLTDMFGSTPSNISCALKDDFSIKVVSGLNLPMLIRVMNYPQLNLEQLSQKAYSGGHDGIISCNKTDDH